MSHQSAYDPHLLPIVPVSVNWPCILPPVHARCIKWLFLIVLLIFFIHYILIMFSLFIWFFKWSSVFIFPPYKPSCILPSHLLPHVIFLFCFPFYLSGNTILFPLLGRFSPHPTYPPKSLSRFLTSGYLDCSTYHKPKRLSFKSYYVISSFIHLLANSIISFS